MVFVADGVTEAGSHVVVVVGRIQRWRDRELLQELPVTLLWEFKDDHLIRISRFPSKEAALAAACSRDAHD